MTNLLPIYRTRAINSVRDSENRIHADNVALQYGFRAGLVAGVTIYGYMTEPIIAHAPEWQVGGAMQVRLLEPFFDNDEVIIKAEAQPDGSITVIAERATGNVCARGTVLVNPAATDPPPVIPEAPLPSRDQRPAASAANVIPGALLGSFTAALESDSQEKLLQLSNEILIQNFRLGPWLHVSSDVRNWSAVRPGETVSVRGRVVDRFDRKGHEFVVADIMLIANGSRLIQTVRHTAIYRLRPPAA